MRNSKYSAYSVLAVCLLLTLLVAPIIVFAGPGDLLPPPNTSLPGGTSGSSNTITYWVGYIINLLLGITGLIAVAFLIIGGFRYMTSAGNSEVAESAKSIIFNAIIGLAVVILSYIIVTVIINALVSNRVS